jgi:hypothetical protein
MSIELCDLYPGADRLIVQVLAWLHDYGKLLGADHAATVVEGRDALIRVGFPVDIASVATDFAARLDSKLDLANASTPIEVKIVSSADGCAHFVGPFFSLWWREHPQHSVEELRTENYRKAVVDWSQKIVLPEARARFQRSIDVIVEQYGAVPGRFFQPIVNSEPRA